MAPTPKKRMAKARSGRRSGMIKAKLPALMKCKSCDKLKYPHKACPHCGKK